MKSLPFYRYTVNSGKMLLILFVSVVSFFVTFYSVPVLIRKFSEAGITGKDVHKPNKPDTPEMGGLAVVAGFVAGVLVAIALSTLLQSSFVPNKEFISESNFTEIFAAIGTILIIAIIGMFDDLVAMRQSVKAILPLFASLPLVAVAAGHPYLTFPLLGQVYLPIIYPLILIPLAVAVVSNLTNMLAGFNGLESGMGLMACLSLGLVALNHGKVDAAILLLSMSAALFAFLLFNKLPARILPGDVGTLSIGACIASAIIIGNFEMAGILLMIPYFADFVIKIKNKFPKEIEYTQLRHGKLTASKVVGLPSLIMHLTGGISESKLVLLLVGIEALLGLTAILLW